MIYLVSAFSDTLIIAAILLFLYFTGNQKIKLSQVICSFVISILSSLLMTLCNLQNSVLFNWIALLVYPLRYIAVLLIVYKHINWKKLYVVVFYEFTIYILISSITNVFENIVTIPFKVLSSIISIAINTLVIIAVLVLRDKIRFVAAHINGVVPRHLYMLVLCATIFLSALSTLNNFSTDITIAKESILNIIIVIFTFIMCCIIVSLLVNVISKQHYSNTTAMLQNQVEIQIRHYDKLDKLNREMNSFRHDYTNHLHSIYSLIEMNEKADALEYIEKLFEAKHKNHIVFNTGNKLADAILTDKVDMLPENISINYNGMIPSSLDNIDLCTILSNALDNAIDACANLTLHGIIAVVAQERQGYFVLTITNPTECTDVFSGIPPTTKADSEYHGMGLMNIQNVVKKYDGQMKVHCENHIFEISITLKL